MIGSVWEKGMRVVLAAALVGTLTGVLLVAGCSDPAAPPAPVEDAGTPAAPPAPIEESAPVDEAPTAAAPSLEESPAAPTPERKSYWLLTEFDWGDDREVVLESIQFVPFYDCRQRNRRGCALTMVKVDDEQLLAQFDFDAAGLYQMTFVTPDLDPDQAKQHLRRVADHLREYVSLHRGEPTVVAELPALETLEFGPPITTHLWRAAGFEARLRVGRRDEGLYYVGVFFSDPARSAARQARDAEIAASDERLRHKRAEETRLRAEKDR